MKNNVSGGKEKTKSKTSVRRMDVKEGESTRWRGKGVRVDVLQRSV